MNYARGTLTNSMRRSAFVTLLALVLAACSSPPAPVARHNILLIYADDLGYGDVGCYGATKVRTPNIDKLAAEGLRFTDGHAAAATCTPSRYALLSGEYAFRKPGTGVLPGNAALVLDPTRRTLASLLRDAGFATAIVGKWHLGLGSGVIDWNQEIAPGPREVGFGYSFVIPATNDRVPCVYLENQRVVGLDPSDPIRIDYTQRVGDEPTGKEHPELLRLPASHGHDQTIVHGIGRIGFMSGGKSARWIDEDMADVLTAKACEFLRTPRKEPFFLWFSAADIHVPRTPHARFVGSTELGSRGDAIVQFDACVGRLLATLDQQGLRDSTLVILTSDNGPVVDDGYRDRAKELLAGHRPAGPFRGGKYSAFEGGTRVPWIVSGPGQVRSGESAALVCQVDLAASLAAWAGVAVQPGEVQDSVDVMAALLGKTPLGRDELVEQAGVLALRSGRWKYIEPGKGQARVGATDTETAQSPSGHLFDLEEDLGERHDLRGSLPERAEALRSRLEQVRRMPQSRPGRVPGR